jgi:hypothetical protein
MSDATELEGPDDGSPPVDIDRSRCVLCGGPNDCALERPGEDGDEAAQPCWCVGRVFPTVLVDRATRRDGGASCICRRCLEAASPTASDEPDA